jgi:hypothetical protein
LRTFTEAPTGSIKQLMVAICPTQFGDYADAQLSYASSLWCSPHPHMPPNGSHVFNMRICIAPPANAHDSCHVHDVGLAAPACSRIPQLAAGHTRPGRILPVPGVRYPGLPWRLVGHHVTGRVLLQRPALPRRIWLWSNLDVSSPAVNTVSGLLGSHYALTVHPKIAAVV